MKNNFLAIGILVTVIAGGAWFMTANQNTPTQNADQNPQAAARATNGSVKQVDPSTFKQLAAQTDTFVIDVHTPEQTHLPNTDAVIPYNDLASHLTELPQDKATPILVYCRSGGMSQQASAELAAMGYTTVYDLAGGLEAYQQAVPAEITISPQNQELGQVIYGQVAESNFTLTNFTNQEITISRLSTSCGCTKATAQTETIPAFGSTQISVSFDPAVHQDDTDLGEITRTIYVETDHPDFPRFEVTISGEVIKA